MGYYIETDSPHNKAEYIIKNYGGRLISYEEALFAMQSKKSHAVIVIVDNGIFEAAAFAFSDAEFEAFTEKNDTRPKKFVVIDRNLCKKLTEYPGE
jgi:uncharacterized protein (DUF1330 family)